MVVDENSERLTAKSATQAVQGSLEGKSKPSGIWGAKGFAQLCEDKLHETMMGAQPGSNYFEWAKAAWRYFSEKNRGDDETRTRDL